MPTARNGELPTAVLPILLNHDPWHLVTEPSPINVDAGAWLRLYGPRGGGSGAATDMTSKTSPDMPRPGEVVTTQSLFRAAGAGAGAPAEAARVTTSEFQHGLQAELKLAGHGRGNGRRRNGHLKAAGRRCGTIPTTGVVHTELSDLHFTRHGPRRRRPPSCTDERAFQRFFAAGSVRAMSGGCPAAALTGRCRLRGAMSSLESAQPSRAAEPTTSTSAGDEASRRARSLMSAPSTYRLEPTCLDAARRFLVVEAGCFDRAPIGSLHRRRASRCRCRGGTSTPTQQPEQIVSTAVI